MSAFSIGECPPDGRQGSHHSLLPRYRPAAEIFALDNRRSFDQSAVNRLSLIKHARGLGFLINDIVALLSLWNNPSRSCREADQIARARLADIEQRVRELQLPRKELRDMIEGYGQRVEKCQIIEGLSDRPMRHLRLKSARLTPFIILLILGAQSPFLEA